ncbi:hypothetical protein [Methylobacterium radiotolerans]|uniref:hypothetical protein n=1 Tax=Methylobacterium radiotolerans TaxID=31998 RepID=UPI001F308274|nr:hypothetical protein [Methylobacterium radiotolerans]UIY45626.1 hypothetical protein LZ599_31180 [Methylobacterium radiotolerans]
MNDASAFSGRLSDVLRLCTLLADRALDARIMGRAVPADQAIALAKAARLLQDHGVDWPPLLTQVLHELAAKDGEPDVASEADQSPDVDMQGLTRFFAGFRGKEQS